MALAIYADESKQERVFAVGAFVLERDAVDGFERQWREQLAAAVPTPLPRFHMTDCEGRHGLYEQWTNAYKVSFLGRLYKIMRAHWVTTMVAALDLDVYDRLSSEERQILGGHTAYSLCIEVLLGNIGLWLRAHDRRGEAAVIMDRVASGAGKTELLRDLPHFKESAAARPDAPLRVVSWGWGSSTAQPALQAADILAYEGAKQAERRLGQWLWPMWRSARALFAPAELFRKPGLVIDAKEMHDHLLPLARETRGMDDERAR